MFSYSEKHVVELIIFLLIDSFSHSSTILSQPNIPIVNPRLFDGSRIATFVTFISNRKTYIIINAILYYILFLMGATEGEMK